MSLVLLELLPDEEKIKSTGMMNTNKHKHISVFFVLYHLILFGNF